TLLFMSRMQESVQSFDDRVYTRTDTNVSVDGNITGSLSATEAENIGAQSIQVTESVNETVAGAVITSETSTSGGSTTRQADKVQWRVASSQEINVAMSNVFSSAGYEVVEAQFVEAASNGLLNISHVS